MSAAVINLRDFERPFRVPPDGDAEIIILPVIRVERQIAAMNEDALRRHIRRNLLGDA